MNCIGGKWYQTPFCAKLIQLKWWSSYSFSSYFRHYQFQFLQHLFNDGMNYYLIVSGITTYNNISGKIHMAFILDANSEENLGPLYYECLHQLLIHGRLPLLHWLVLAQLAHISFWGWAAGVIRTQPHKQKWWAKTV